MKKFYYLTSGNDLHIYQAVNGVGHSEGINLEGDRIYFLEEDVVGNIQGGTAHLTVFGDSYLNMLGEPLAVDSIITSLPDPATDDTWYLVSTLSTGTSMARVKNNLAHFGTSGAEVGWKYLAPFSGMYVNIAGRGIFEFNRTGVSDTRWKKLDIV